MSQLVDNTLNFVSSLLSSELPKTTLYHNLTHTERVFKSTKEIIENNNLSEEDEEVLLLTALLHDTGYIHGAENHEEKSIEIATTFLKEQGVTDEVIERVSECIRATKFDRKPKTLLDKIIRDADASHFAKDYYQMASEFLRQELKLHNIVAHNKEKWLEGNIELLTSRHKYYTDYAIEHWNPKKEENLKIMIEKQEKMIEKQKIKEDKQKKKDEAKRAKAEDPEKAIQSVFRVTLKNHIKLSDIADTKANILLSVNAIIISIALSNLIPKLDNPSNQYLIVPTLIFLLFTVVSIVLSVLATRPNVTSGRFTTDDVKDKKVNLLFFGNFHKMTLPEFDWAMNEMLKDKDYIYSSMTKDLYFLGLVLQRKYKILRLTYNIFMTGIVVSTLAFGLAFQFYGT